MLKNKYSIIPKPTRYKTIEGFFYLTNSVLIYSYTEYIIQGKILQQIILKDTNISLKVTGHNKQNKIIRLLFNKDIIHPEAYILEISAGNITISASTDKGIFYGIQTLRQIVLQCPDMKLAVTVIEDYPRFEWRGLHLDVSRHFFQVSFIFKLLDTMSFYKLNRFHWHLTDDQGWRIEVKKYPRLTKTGSYRKQKDGSVYGSYYSQKEIKEVIAYAGKLHIKILPEIEMPGHAVAAIAVYPELSCRQKKLEVWNRWGISDDVFCAGKEQTFTFLENVLSEVIDLFPWEYIHMGGDECPKTRWKKCPDCQKRMVDEGLKNEEELQSYFMRRISSYLVKKGKKIIGWDEILDGGFTEKAVIMAWREDGIRATIKAADLGDDVIFCPNKVFYLDWKQTTNDKRGVFGISTIGNIYNYNPIPKNLSEEEAGHIIGVQGNIWTERMKSSQIVEYMTFPRALAVAETGWSKSKDGWDDFAVRVKAHLKILAGMDINSCQVIEK